MSLKVQSLYLYKIAALYKVSIETLRTWLSKLDQSELKSRGYEPGKNRIVPPKAVEYIFEKLGDPRI